MNPTVHIGHTAKLLCEEPFWRLYEDFTKWRIDPFIRQLEKGKKRGRILPFVRGLHLSAHLIYAIREVLSGTNLTADWGHLLDKTGSFCSCECDVIIHHKGYKGRWNGNEKPIMDFRFIEQEKAVAVISCKSFLRSTDIDKEYSKLMEPYIKRIWLFAECCGPRSTKSIENKSKEFGYEKFWHLYTWSKQKNPEPNQDGWTKFVKEVEKLTS